MDLKEVGFEDWTHMANRRDQWLTLVTMAMIS